MNASNQVPAVRLVVVDGVQPAHHAVASLKTQRIEQFLGTRSLATNTKRNYERQLLYFLEWVDKDWHTVTLNDLKNYRAHLEQKGLAIASVGAYLTALKSLLTWMMKAGFLEKSPAAALEIPAAPEGEGKNLEAHMVAALFEALPSRGYAESRDRAILCLLVRAGLRAQEVSALNVGHYNGVEVNIVEAKHGSTGLVPVDDETHMALKEYLLERWIETQEQLSSGDPLFVSYSNRNRGDRLSYEGIYKIVKDLASSAGLEGVHPHRGRHTFISNMVENGLDAQLAMELSRQRSMKSYKRYSQKVRYKAAKAAFLKGKGEKERKPMSLEQMLEENNQHLPKPVLDPCCGSRMGYFDREHPNVVYGDIRTEEHTLCDGRSLEIKPDVMLDFRALPYADGSFKVVVFDPPHLVHAGEKSWLVAKYGKLSENWREDLRQGFSECFRVLEPHGILIFKWNETQIKVREILALTEIKPLFGHPNGRKGLTHWMTFMKPGD